MDFAEQLKSSVDIVKTIGEYVRLKRTGSHRRYMGLCPFHTEKTPSFNVQCAISSSSASAAAQGGDVFNFVMEIERISFFEALKLLAERNGIAMPKREYSDPDSKLRGALMEMHEIAAEHFQANLNGPAGAEARNYLARRGVNPEQIAEFGLGISDASAANSWCGSSRSVRSRASGAVGPGDETPGWQRLLRPFSRPADVPHSQRIR